MTLVSLTDCCRLLFIDPKTLRRWLSHRGMAVQPHPLDARLKCVTPEQMQQLAATHHRALSQASGGQMPPETSVLSTPTGHTSGSATSDVSACITGLTKQLASLQAHVSMLEHQLILLVEPEQQGRRSHAQVSQDKSLESSQEKSLESSQDKSLKSSQDKFLESSQEKSLKSSQDNSLKSSQEKSLKSSQDNSLPSSQDKSLKSSQDKSLPSSQDKSPKSSQDKSLPSSQDKSLKSSQEKSLKSSQDKSLESSQDQSRDQVPSLPSASIDRRKHPRVLPLVEYGGGGQVCHHQSPTGKA